MNIPIQLNKVQIEQLKDVMKRQKRTFSMNEAKKYFLDTLNSAYLKK